MAARQLVSLVMGRLFRGTAYFAPNTSLFGMQLLVSVVGLVVSTGMLFMGRDAAVYLPILTSIIGYWLPAPKQPAAAAPPATPALPPTPAPTAQSAVASTATRQHAAVVQEPSSDGHTGPTRDADPDAAQSPAPAAV